MKAAAAPQLHQAGRNPGRELERQIFPDCLNELVILVEAGV